MRVGSFGTGESHAIPAVKRRVRLRLRNDVWVELGVTWYQ